MYDIVTLLRGWCGCYLLCDGHTINSNLSSSFFPRPQLTSDLDTTLCPPSTVHKYPRPRPVHARLPSASGFELTAVSTQLF